MLHTIGAGINFPYPSISMIPVNACPLMQDILTSFANDLLKDLAHGFTIPYFGTHSPNRNGSKKLLSGSPHRRLWILFRISQTRLLRQLRFQHRTSFQHLTGRCTGYFSGVLNRPDTEHMNVDQWPIHEFSSFRLVFEFHYY